MRTTMAEDIHLAIGGRDDQAAPTPLRDIQEVFGQTGEVGLTTSPWRR